MTQAEAPREPDPRFNQVEREHLATLRHRVDWLAQQVVPGGPRSQDWTRRELASLRWVLALLDAGELHGSAAQGWWLRIPLQRARSGPPAGADHAEQA